MEILGKETVSGNCIFPQNFRTRKLGEIMVFYAVSGDFSYHLSNPQITRLSVQTSFEPANIKTLNRIRFYTKN